MLMLTITLPRPIWTPDEDADDDEVEFEDPFAVPVTHPIEDRHDAQDSTR